MGDHEIDGRRGAHLGGDDDIALVLAVLVIDQDVHAAVAGFLDDLLDGDQHGRFVIVGQEAFQLAQRFGGGVPVLFPHIAQRVGMETGRAGQPDLVMPPSLTRRRTRSMVLCDMGCRLSHSYVMAR
jgi:hypothetical protein